MFINLNTLFENKGYKKWRLKVEKKSSNLFSFCGKLIENKKWTMILIISFKKLNFQLYKLH